MFDRKKLRDDMLDIIKRNLDSVDEHNREKIRAFDEVVSAAYYCVIYYSMRRFNHVQMRASAWLLANRATFRKRGFEHGVPGFSEVPKARKPPRTPRKS